MECTHRKTVKIYAHTVYKSTELSEMLHRGLKAKLNISFSCTQGASIFSRDTSDSPASLDALGKISHGYRKKKK